MTKKYKSGKSISKKLFMAPLTRLRATMPGHMPNALMGKYYSQRSGNNGASNIITEATNVSDTATGYYAEPGIFTEIQEFECILRGLARQGRNNCEGSTFSLGP